MSTVDWKTEVEAYSRKSAEHLGRVAKAEFQVSPQVSDADYWEAVYTLVRQAEQMEDAREVFEP